MCRFLRGISSKMLHFLGKTKQLKFPHLPPRIFHQGTRSAFTWLRLAFVREKTIQGGISFARATGGAACQGVILPAQGVARSLTGFISSNHARFNQDT